MSRNEERPKLKPNRFNKFEISGSRFPTKTLSTSSDIPKRPHKRIHNEIQVCSNSKKMCYGLMHPPSTTVNLANNRLQKLKQTLQADLKKRKETLPTLFSNIDTTEKPSINDSPTVSIDSHSPKESRKSIYKNLNKWASPGDDSHSGNPANQRLKRLKEVINETATDNGTPKFSDSSGTPSQKSIHDSSPRTPRRLSTSMKNSSKNSQSPVPLSQTPKSSSPEYRHYSPLLRDKINCKRKINKSPNLDEHTTAKQFLSDSYLPNQNISKVRKSIVDKSDTVPLNKSSNFPLSARSLKIKSNTEQINNSLDNSYLSPVSAQFDKTFNNNKSPSHVHSPNLSGKGFIKLDEQHNSSNSFATPISERLKLYRKHPYSNDKSKDQNSSDSKILSPSANNLAQESSMNLSSVGKSNLKNNYSTTTHISPQTHSDRHQIISKHDAAIRNLTGRDFNKVEEKSSSIPQQLRLNKQHLFSNNKPKNEHPKVRSLSAIISSQESSLNFSSFNKSDLKNNYSTKSSTHVTPQMRLNRCKVISLDTSKKQTSHNVEVPSFARNDLNRQSLSTNSTLPLNMNLTREHLNSTEKVNQNHCDFKAPADIILNQKSLSALHAPLPPDSNDDFCEKMAMTASWIRNHQEFGENYKINTKKTSEDIVVRETVNATDESEEMEWTNAEPDNDVPEIPKTVEKQVVEHNNQETQTQLNTKTEEKDKYICIVVDTNIFISELSKLSDVINLKVTGPIQPLVYIPWMVVTELDEMKDRSGNNSLKLKVVNAIKYINKLLSEDNPRVKGQTVCDMGKQVHVGASQDDKIIGTCLQAAEKYESVILLSNDVNLKNKAMINNIAAASAQEIIMKIMSKLVKNTKYQKIMQKMSMLCSSIICECAKEAYGDVWLRMDMLSNPPWSLLECTKRFQKYWTAVFHEKLMKQFLTTVDKLQQLLTNNKYFCDDSDKYNEFVKLSLNLCIFLKDMEEYRGSIENTIKVITNIG